MSSQDKINKLLEYSGLNASDFARKIKIKNVQSIYDIQRGQGGVSKSMANKIVASFPEINIGWLLSDDENMLKSYAPENIPQSNAIIKEQNTRIMSVPLISQYAQAGYLSGYADPEYLEHQPYEIVEADYTPGNYVAFEVKGDSMEDGTREAIYAGDIIIGRELYRDHWKNNFRKNEVYVIVHREQGICVKEVVGRNMENGTITLHSKNPEYADYTVNLDDVLQIFYKKELRRK